MLGTSNAGGCCYVECAAGYRSGCIDIAEQVGAVSVTAAACSSRPPAPQIARLVMTAGSTMNQQ